MRRLQLLDYGRMAAALCVLAYHYFFNGIESGRLTTISQVPDIVAIARYGYLGVHFFFMISGYVIFESAQARSASQFAVSRLVRLVPAFWIAVLLTSAFALGWGGARMSVTPAQVAANLTMLPGVFGQPFVDGVYWTLQLELMFYTLVLAVLLLGLQRHLRSFAIAWPLFMLLGLAIDKPHLPFAGQYFAFFSAGALFAVLKTRASTAVLASLGISLLLCLQFACRDAIKVGLHTRTEFSPLIVCAVICTFFGFFAFLNSARCALLILPASRLAGALTYPVYLIHANVGYMVLTRFGNDSNRPQAYAATIALVFLLSYLIHRWGERRYARQWHALFTNLLEKPLGWLQRRLQLLGSKASP